MCILVVLTNVCWFLTKIILTTHTFNKLMPYIVLAYLVVYVKMHPHCLCLQLKEFNHDNIKPFIGACVEPGHICYLTQLCSRGTLQVCTVGL